MNKELIKNIMKIKQITGAKISECKNA